MNRRNFLTSMVAALVAAPVVARAAVNASAWGESAVIVSELPSHVLSTGSYLKMYAHTEAELRKIISYTRVIDCRWMSLQHAMDNGRYSESASASDDGSAHPLRFNDKDTFIEPMFAQSESDGVTWRMNPVWQSAKYQVTVSPDTNNPVEYRMDIRSIPEEGLWIGRLTRDGKLPFMARPTATYFKRP